MLEMGFYGATSTTGFIHQIKFPVRFLCNFSSKEVILTPRFYPLKCVIFLHVSNVTNSKLMENVCALN